MPLVTPSQSIWGATLLAVLIASALPLLATWWLATRPSVTTALLPRLILVASGALIGAAAFHLIPDALVEGTPARVALLVVLGALALGVLERVIHSLERPSATHAPHAAHGHRAHLMPLGIASDALHNTIDGALIATAFVTNPSLGMFAGAAIALHELPRELGTYALCVEAGMSPRRAILVNAGTGVLALLGAALALIVGGAVQRLGVILVPFAAGNFLYLAGAILVAQRGRSAAGDLGQRFLYVRGRRRGDRPASWRALVAGISRLTSGPPPARLAGRSIAVRSDPTPSVHSAPCAPAPRLFPRLTPVVLAFVAGACAQAPAPSIAPSRALESRIYATKARGDVSFETMMRSASRADVVFFGEQHDDPATHRAELSVLAALGNGTRPVVLSLEMFERDVQGVLDDYLAGRISEAEFLAHSRPWERYTTDYRALVELARARGWPVVASNIPRRLASAVSRKGLAVLDTMSASDRALVARDIACPRDAYYTNFAEQMKGHSAGRRPGLGGRLGGDAGDDRPVLRGPVHQGRDDGRVDRRRARARRRGGDRAARRRRLSLRLRPGDRRARGAPAPGRDADDPDRDTGRHAGDRSPRR